MSKHGYTKVKEWVRLHACEGIRVCDASAAFTDNPDYLSRLRQATHKSEEIPL